MKTDLRQLTDDELIESLKRLVGDERRTVAAVLRHLNEFDRRKIAAGKGFPSLFEYCVRELKYAQGETARRIQSARAAEKYPVLYAAIERGLLSLTVVSILAPHLKWDNYRKLIRASKGLSTREVEALVASLHPVAKAPPERVRFISVAKPEPPRAAEELFAPAVETAAAAPMATAPLVERPVAAVPTAQPAVPAAAPVEPPTAASPPAAPETRVVFTFTGDEGLFRDVERVKELSRHKWPAGKLEDVFAGAIKALLSRIDPDRRERRKERVRRLAAGVRSRSRHIAKAVKDEVWVRDGGRCAFEADGGRACGARSGLEFDHVRPWALGGSNETANIRLLCRNHNDLEARRVFGEAAIAGAAGRRRGALRNGVEI